MGVPVCGRGEVFAPGGLGFWVFLLGLALLGIAWTTGLGAG
jgi:hypothetical protein